MARFFGKVGFLDETRETSPGVWEEIEIERPYYGDILSQNVRFERTENRNDDEVVSTRIQIVADPYALLNYFHIRYVWHMGVKWKVTSVEPARPRITLSLGDVYNG